MRKKSNSIGKSVQSKVIVLSGIFLALTVIILYVESIAPTGRLSLYALSSVFVSILIVESGIKPGWLFYLSSSLVSFIIVPDKLALVPYIVFFGLYGIVKYYAERQKYIWLEYTIKFLYFNLCVVLAYFIIKNLFTIQMKFNLHWWLIIIALQIFFFLYDYVYSLIIQYYRKRLRRILKSS